MRGATANFSLLYSDVIWKTNCCTQSERKIETFRKVDLATLGESWIVRILQNIAGKVGIDTAKNNDEIAMRVEVFVYFSNAETVKRRHWITMNAFWTLSYEHTWLKSIPYSRSCKKSHTEERTHSKTVANDHLFTGNRPPDVAPLAHLKFPGTRVNSQV